MGSYRVFGHPLTTKPQTVGQWAYCLARIILALIFIGSAVTKLLAPKSFVLIIEAYGLIPEGWIWPAGLALTLAELLAGVGLLLDTRWSLNVITGLLLLFMGILSYGVWLGLDVDCGCFGPHDPEGEAFHGLKPALLRDALMLAAIGFLYFWRRRRRLLYHQSQIMEVNQNA